MPGRAVLFAITPAHLEALEALDDPDERVEFIEETFEEPWDETWLCELDKAWDAIHRCLNEGCLDDEVGEFPMSAVIFGRTHVMGDEDEPDYYVGLTRPEDVVAVAAALVTITEESLREGYARIDPDDYDGDFGDDDLAYTLGWFVDLPAFWRRAADSGRAVIFACDR